MFSVVHVASRIKRKKKKKKQNKQTIFCLQRDKVYWIKRLVRTSSRNHYQIHVYLRLTGACMCLDLNNCRIIIVKIYSKTFYILYWTRETKLKISEYLSNQFGWVALPQLNWTKTTSRAIWNDSAEKKRQQTY